MYDYSCMLALLRASRGSAAPPIGRTSQLARMTTERSLRNRARAITQRLQNMTEPRQHQLSPRPSAACRRCARPAACRAGAWR